MAEQVEIVCGGCGVLFWMSEPFFQARKRDHKTWYCPAGCSRAYNGPNDEEKLRLERDRLKQQLACKDDDIRYQREARERAERSASAMRGQVTKLKKRAANGVCPCCSRTFVNLQRHMATKHAGFVAEEIVPEGATVQ